MMGGGRHCDLRVKSSQPKMYKNFAKAKSKCFIVLICTCQGLQKSLRRYDTSKSTLSKKIIKLDISSLNL